MSPPILVRRRFEEPRGRPAMRRRPVEAGRRPGVGRVFADRPSFTDKMMPHRREKLLLEHSRMKRACKEVALSFIDVIRPE